MRFLLVAAATFLAFTSPLSASQGMSADDAEAMRIQARADKSDRMHGQVDYLYEDEDGFVDATTGTGKGDECSQAPVRMKRSDGAVIVRRLDVCD